MMNSQQAEIGVATAFGAIVVFQFFHILLQWVYVRRRDYPWYLAYILTISIFCFSKLPAISQHSNFFDVLDRNFDLLLPMLSYLLYYQFSSSFLKISEAYPRLFVWVRRLQWILLTYICCDLFLLALGNTHDERHLIFLVMSAILGICSLSFIFILFRIGNDLSYFIISGALVITLGSLCTMLLLLREFDAFNPMWINIGAGITEFLIFNTGLAFKARMIERSRLERRDANIDKLEAHLRIKEQTLEIRQKASREIHEEIGSHASDVAIFAELLDRELEPHQDKARNLNVQIRTKTRIMLDSIQDIIWAMQHAHEGIPGLEQKLRMICREKLGIEGIPWDIQMQTPSDASDAEPDADSLRKSVRIIREWLNWTNQRSLKRIQIMLHFDTHQIEVRSEFQDHPGTRPEILGHLLVQSQTKVLEKERHIILFIPLTRIRD